MAGGQPIAVPRVLLPIGISFFTFHAISCLSTCRRDATAQKSPVHAALYLLLLPQLIAGPIIRYRDIADQLARRLVTVDDFGYGVRRFIIGLAKKVLVANVVAGPADRIFAMPVAELSAGHAWLGLTCYTLQIYFDFSGYSDMAIGLGRMFGFRFPENFRWPYIAGSVQEFWRRWHITLSTWFRDYLYIPLGGNRVSPARRYRNLVTVFFLCGLWHGASWNFVIWGLWHGTFLVIERLLATKTRSHEHDQSFSLVRGFVAIRWLWRHAYTMLVVMIGWVFFRADTLPGAVAFLRAMAGLSDPAPTIYTLRWYLTSELWLTLTAGVIGSTPWVVALARRLARAEPPPFAWPVSLASTTALAALLVASLVSIAARTYNPFIYFRF
jgi:alginate O-acetyltransferase complex protein AlgI